MRKKRCCKRLVAGAIHGLCEAQRRWRTAGVYTAFAVAAIPGVSAPILVLEQVGDGASKLTSSAAPVILQYLTTDGSVTGTAILPSGNVRPQSPPYHLMESGGADSDGQLTRSVNGLYIQVPGYNATNGETAIANSSAAVVYRTIGLLSTEGAVDTSRAFSMLTSNNFRSVVSVGGAAFWAAGHAGLAYVAGSTLTPLMDLNFRNINIFNGQLFCTMGGSLPGIYTVGSGLPTTTPVLAFIYLPVGGPSGSPFGFQFNSSMTSCYVADDRTNAGGGIIKFTYSSGAWVSNYTLGTGPDSGARGLTVDWTQTGLPVLYATTSEPTNNRLIKIVDNGESSAPSTLLTAAHHTIFRGVDFLGLAAAWRYGLSGNWSVGGTTPWSNWSLCLANGIPLQFQNVNSGTAPLALSATNNSGLSWVKSISFAGGYGTSAGSSYTLRGNALSVAGGIMSDSPLTQKIQLPLTLTADQSFTTGPGEIVLDGVLSGSVALSKAGSGAVVLNAFNRCTGSVTVNEGELAINGTLTNSLLNVTGGVLSGTGTISGPVVVQTPAELSPAGSSAIGTLNIRGQLTLLGTTTMEISKNGTNSSCDSIAGVTTLICGGVLNVKLLTGNLAAGDAFNLFRPAQFAGAFQSFILPPPSAGLYWDTTGLLTTGTLKVGAVAPAKLDAPQLGPSGTAQFQFSGGPGLTYRVWAADDVSLQPVEMMWTPIDSGAFGADGRASFIDYTAPFYTRRFYRVSVP